MTNLLEQAIAKIKKLPESEQDNIAQIILKEIENLNPLPQGVKGEQLNRFAGIINKEDLQLMNKAILEGCEVVDAQEW
ncbi:MAG: hypothetical protein QNJ18_00190 [Xenococcaceae cyanobacterium MO_167.B52]|nr:hypothetical protein [Xenococcaceae cyanobacterium MO_167.B52]